MILCIDVGNTQTVLGCIEDGQILRTIRLTTIASETAEEAAVRLLGVLSFHGLSSEALDGAILSSVVPAVTETLKAALPMILSGRLLIVGPGIRTGLNVRIDDPGTLAADLLVGAVSAMNFYTLPAIIIDMGTAITLTAVDQKGCYRGGVIMPGVRLSFGALSRGTSLLPDISFSAPKKVIGSNTVDAMRSGALYGTASMIDGLVERMEEELKASCTVIATGGQAPFVIPFCRKKILVDEDLLMKGLYYLYRKNID